MKSRSAVWPPVATASVVIPRLNKKELDEIAPHLRRGLEIHLADEVDEVLRLALIPPLDVRSPADAKPKASYPGKPRSKPIVV